MMAFDKYYVLFLTNLTLERLHIGEEDHWRRQKTSRVADGSDEDIL